MKFTHETKGPVEGTIVGNGVGPHGHSRVTVHITPEELMKHGLDREARHRRDGMTRQVPRRWIIQEED